MSYQTMPMTDQKGNAVHMIIAWVIAVLSVGYFLPWAIAASRRKSNTLAIALLDLLLGWTIIGWIIALVMACGSHQMVAPVVVNNNMGPGYPQQGYPQVPPQPSASEERAELPPTQA